MTITRKRYCWGRLEQEKREMNGVGSKDKNEKEIGVGSIE